MGDTDGLEGRVRNLETHHASFSARAEAWWDAQAESSKRMNARIGQIEGSVADLDATTSHKVDNLTDETAKTRATQQVMMERQKWMLRIGWGILSGLVVLLVEILVSKLL